jgi:uncharacterized Tic20 family protein
MSDQEKWTSSPDQPAAPTDESGVAIPVKLRQNVMEAVNHASDEARKSRLSVNVAEDDQRQAESVQRKRSQFNFPAAYRRPARPAPEHVSDNEKLWAALAHASTLFTFAMALGSAGILSLFTIFIPLGIYLAYRHKSEFVAHHALQAFAAQVVGVIGFLALVAMVVAVWTILLVISAILILVLIGIPLLVLVLVAGFIALAATLLLPFGTLVYSMIAAVEAWNGKPYAYPWLGDWVDDQIYS